jgi:hypothetical protein
VRDVFSGDELGRTHERDGRPSRVQLRAADRIRSLTGTSNAEHMKQDLDSLDAELSPESVRAIESLAG